jgi:hypothetical protein
MRPVSIVWFERIYLFSIALGLLSTMMNWSVIIAAAQAAPNAAQLPGSIPAFSLIVIAFSIGINLLIWYFIARRGSNVARWIFTAFFVFGLLVMPSSLSNPLYGPGLVAMAVFNTLLQVAALVCLFRPDARDWFKRRKPVDTNVFD